MADTTTPPLAAEIAPPPIDVDDKPEPATSSAPVVTRLDRLGQSPRNLANVAKRYRTIRAEEEANEMSTAP
jgi:hypothetical protein